MKSFLKITLLGSAIALALVGCDDKKENATQSSSTEVTQGITEINIDVTEDVEAYAVGASFGSYLKGNLARNDISLNNKEILKGFEAALNDKTKYTQEEVQYILSKLDERLAEEREVRLEKAKQESTEAGEKFREEFLKQPDVKQTESGILYQIIEEGSDKYPSLSDTVLVHYKGTLVDGRTFDSSYDRGEVAKFPLLGVIKGWQEGIQLIGVGGKIKLVVPSELAYGEQEIPAQDDKAGIPPFSTLVFEVELLGIDEPATNTDNAE